MKRRYKVGNAMRTWFDDGRGGTWVYGVVTHAGPKLVTIRWESGRTQRRAHDNPNIEKHFGFTPKERSELDALLDNFVDTFALSKAVGAASPQQS